jgi:hypothetical protein
VVVRHRSSIDPPPAIPDLIGLRDRLYLDKIPVVGFTPPLDHEWRFDIMSTSIDTDPTLALLTRRGTILQGTLSARLLIPWIAGAQRLTGDARRFSRPQPRSDQSTQGGCTNNDAALGDGDELRWDPSPWCLEV